MNVYAVDGKIEQHVGRCPDGGVLMPELRPGPLWTCSTQGCEEGHGVWVEDECDVWIAKIAVTDCTMTRATEEIWDHLGIENAPAKTQSYHAEKKALRAVNPC